MVYRALWLAVLFIGACASPGPEDWRTDFEKSNGLETPTYEQTVRYIRRLEKGSPWVRLSHFGQTPEGRPMPLVVVDKSGKFSPSSARALRKAVVLVQAGIHAGEIDGKDAGLMLVRDMVIHRQHAELLDRIVLVFIPILNVDGHERRSAFNRINQNGPKEMGWRVTAQNLNLNRDYMKADAPEMRAWLKLFHMWKPDLFVDCHVTDGADYRHVVTYAMDVTQNVAEPVRSWSRTEYLPELTKRMKSSGFPVSPYVWPVDDRNISKGIIGGTAPPRFATAYATICNRPALLIETHMMKDYRTRVMGTYAALLHTLEIVYDRCQELQRVVEESDEQTAGMMGRTLAVRFEQTDRSDTIDFSGYNYLLEPSAISNDDWVVWENVPIDYSLPYYNYVRDTDTAVVPYAFAVPRAWTTVMDVLRVHGVETRTVGRSVAIDVASYRFRRPVWATKPFEGRITVEMDSEPIRERRTLNRDDYLIIMDQPLNRVIMHLLEPGSPDSFVRWGFFNAIFEQKEYGEAYILEKMARDMIATNPDLEREFLEAVGADTALARDSYQRLNWFYQRSPYWDKTVCVYPISKILHREDLENAH